MEIETVLQHRIELYRRKAQIAEAKGNKETAIVLEFCKGEFEDLLRFLQEKE